MKLLSRHLQAWMLLGALLLGLLPAAPAAACSAGGCVSAGPRLASVSSSRGALLNALLGNLTGSTLNVSVADWNAIATGDVSVLKTINALQTQLGVSSPATALATSASLAQVVAAMATAATGDGSTALATSLAGLQSGLGLTAGTIKLGDLLVTDGGVGDTKLNALELVTGAIQLYNRKNVATTPTPIGLTGSALGLSSILTNVALSAQVVEAPVFVCGPVGSTFHTATVRIKLDIDLVGTPLNVSALTALGVTASVQLTKLTLYLEIARADGILTAVNAISGAISVQATPGVADIYLGLMNDNVFFDRTHVVSAADMTPAVVASATINGITLSIKAQGSARGQAPSATTLNFTGPYPQVLTAYTRAGVVNTLISDLIANLTFTITPSLGGILDALVLGPLKLIVKTALSPVLGTVLGSVVDPLLELLGVRLGEVDVQVGGTYYVCAVSGSVYNDANHSATQDSGEAGTGTTLYAKLIATTTPSGPASYVATVDGSTGAYSFSGVGVGSYTLVIGTAAAAANITPTGLSGWLGTETPTLSRSVTISTADLSGLRFGLYRGSRISGTVFKDTGTGGGTPNNGVRDGTEVAIVGATLTLTDSTGTTTLGRTTTGDQGAYSLWVPYTAVGVVKVLQPGGAAWVAVGGSAGNSGGAYALATDTTTFTAASGNDYTGLNFAKVPANKFDTDGQQSALPGKVVFYAHNYTAGTAGQLSFITSAPATAGYSVLLYDDVDCSGQLDGTEPLISAARSVVAGQKICVLAKVSVPVNAPYGSQYPLAITAHLAYANSSVVSDQQRQDVTIVSDGSDGGLRLVKAVDKASAATGDVITYTITYRNWGTVPLSTMKIIDQTPAYTVFSSAGCGTTPDVGLVCAVTLQPGAGTAGRVEWTFTGNLNSGASGTVTLRVVLQ